MEDLIVPRRVKSSKSKDKILRAAHKIISENGFDYLTVRNVCQVANVSTGSFYHFFPNKEALLSMYLSSSYQKGAEEMAAKGGDHDFRERIIDTYVEHARYLEQSGLDFVCSYYTVKNTALDTFHHKTERIEFTTRELAKAQEEGLVAADETPEALSLGVCFVMKGCVFSWCLANGDFDLSASVEKVIGAYLRGISTEAYLAQAGGGESEEAQASAS